MNRSHNRKALYTKNLLADTLIEMLDTFLYREITILQICQYSNISRASFYRNFKTKDEVLEHYIQNVIDKKIPDQSSSARMFLKASESIDVWFDEKKLLKKLYANDLFGIYTNKLNEVINHAFSLRKTDFSDPFYEYMATEMAYIISSIFYKWAERDFKESRLEMTALLERLHSSRARRELIHKNEKELG